MISIKKYGKKLIFTMTFCFGMLGLSACASNNSDASHVPESYSSSIIESSEPEASVEAMESSAEESIDENGSLDESNESVTNETEAENHFAITAEEAISYVNSLLEQHSDAVGIAKIPVVFLAIHYDYMSDEDKNFFIKSFDLDASALSNDLNEYLKQVEDFEVYEVRNNIRIGEYDETTQSYDRLVKLEDLTTIEDFKELARQCDEAIYYYVYNGNVEDLKKLVLYFNDESNIKSSIEKFYNIRLWEPLGKDLENVFD